MAPNDAHTKPAAPTPKLPAPKIPHVYVERGLGAAKVEKR